MNERDRKIVLDACRSLDDAIRYLELLILATPTSERRNKLSDANIHLQAASAALKEAAQS